MKTLILTNIDPDLYRSQSEHRANVNANVLPFILMTFSRKKVIIMTVVYIFEVRRV